MAAADISNTAGLRYGALGFPLAFVALPLYINLPAFYAQNFGLSLGLLGLLLLGSRLLDALVDPLIGLAADGWLGRSRRFLLGLLSAAALLLATSFWALFHPPVQGESSLLLWCAIFLTVSYFAYSLLSITHQAWGARLGGGPLQQTRLNAWREGLALAGVVAASVLPNLGGMGLSSAALAVALAAGLLALSTAPRDTGTAPAAPGLAWIAWKTPGFRRLLSVFLVNGVASAIPATLLLFFVRDRLQTPQAEALYLASYFLAAALSMPLWLRLVARVGQARAWGLAMLLAVLSFAWAASLGEGAMVGFTLVCIASGATLGADLSIPGAMLTRVLQQAGLAGRAEGAFFGWWNLFNKLSLALAAGLALPLLQALGYRPGQHDPQGLQALALAYCLLPCLLKLAAAALLYLLCIRPAAVPVLKEAH